MACDLIGAKPLTEPMLTYYQLDPWEQISMIFKYKIRIQENAFENVAWEMAVILSRPQFVSMPRAMKFYGFR